MYYQRFLLFFCIYLFVFFFGFWTNKNNPEIYKRKFIIALRSAQSFFAWFVCLNGSQEHKNLHTFFHDWSPFISECIFFQGLLYLNWYILTNFCKKQKLWNVVKCFSAVYSLNCQRDFLFWTKIIENTILLVNSTV